MTPPPSLPPTGEGLPEEIVKAIEELRDAEHRHGAAYFSDGGSQVRLERLADRVADRLDATILRHLTEKQERSRLEAEGWGQASVVSCYWIQSKPDHELVPVVNLDLRKLYEATHELTHETALSAALARAERAERALMPFAKLATDPNVMTNYGTSIQNVPTGLWTACGLNLLVEDIRAAAAALSSVAEEA